MPSGRHLRNDEGFTLVEVLMAALVLVVGVLGVLAMLDQANRATARTKTREAGISLAREMVEASRAVPYPNLTPSTVQAQLQAQPGLADATAGGAWQVVRRNKTFTVTAVVCSVDDGQDGFGDHTGGSYCANSSSTGTADTNPDDYKRVSIDVSWSDQGASTGDVKQVAVINNVGSAFAPTITALTASPASPVTSGTSVTFTATASSAQELRWYVDNVQKGVIAGPATSFAFTWDLTSVVDGTYVVSASAFDRYGEAGTGRALTMIVNRAAPAKPTGLVGSRNGLWGSTVVDLRWNPNPEHDITGYEVYRYSGAGSPNPAADTRICQTQLSDASPYTCVDPSAPPVGTTVHYYVRAVAPARPPATGSEYSATPTAAETLGFDNTNARPAAPTNVQVTASGNGATTLSWTAATDPDGTISGYRIYRDDNSSYTKRYDLTGSGATVTWTDTQVASGSHTYWVTAIDNQLAESPFAPAAGVSG